MKEELLVSKMLEALAAAKTEPHRFLMRRKDVRMERDVCVPVDANGNIIGNGVDSMNPKTWPCAVLLFVSALVDTRKRIFKRRKSRRSVLALTMCPRFYAWNPFNPPTVHFELAGEDFPPGTFLVKVAEREIPPWDDTF